MAETRGEKSPINVQQYEVDAWENPDIVTEVKADDSPFEEIDDDFLDEDLDDDEDFDDEDLDDEDLDDEDFDS